jgi:WD40 repeat protein
VAVTPDDTRIVTASRDETIRVWDLATGDPLTGHTNRVTSVAVTPDGTRIVSGSDDNTVRVWEPGIGECLLELTCFGAVGAVAAALLEAIAGS